ncbi:transporter substrate-binding domain-containing protein, partial [Staphylococcus simulans]
MIQHKALNIIKVFICTVFLLGIILPLFNLKANAEAQDPVWEKIKQRGELRVGLSADYAPYEFESSKNGKREYVGIDVELAKKIAKDNHLKLKIENMSFDSLLGALKTGKIDMIISGMTPTPERKKEVDFSDFYMKSGQSIIVKKTEIDKYKSLRDFDNKRIAAQKQTTQEQLAKTE